MQGTGPARNTCAPCWFGLNVAFSQECQDVRCKVAESDTIVAAMQSKNIPVAYVVYPDEGHGFAKPPNRLSYIAMMEMFLARHLGGAFEPLGVDLEGSSHEIRTGQEILTDLGAI